ncbi:type II toxin-antitoxin system HicB family antitoxin [Maribacter litoralis]|uniref:type II toxin-antitoxin system HicB family antitoxin n=1 Tax=Maribacter litoralis TaxID=2059726 RepID=UPI000E3143F1|nr:type II toxin-antitoxin system HicB family antitoxin [Maribacter litoralis]|tara:strand:+ start:16198 stop:16551 length:354 start_codon:yes stop_codon:yes gene_type:complete
MADYLKHKNYFGSVEFSAEDAVLHGKIIGINDLVTFEANSVEELQQAFIDSVDDYLETCMEVGKEPNKFFKGAFNVRTSRSVHRYLAVIAEKKQMKLNEVVNKAFDFLIKNEDEVLN